MERCTLRIVAVLIITILGTVMNASALDFIAANGNWRKGELGILIPAMSDMLTKSGESYCGANDFYNINENEIAGLYASKQLQENSPPSSLIEVNLNEPDDGSHYGRLHKYFGYGTVLLAGMAAASGSYRSLHYGSAYAATGTALGTCLTGYMEYGDRFDLEDGLLSEDNLHMILGVLGTVGLVTAVAIEGSGQSSHSAVGGAGGAAMLLSVMTIKW